MNVYRRRFCLSAGADCSAAQRKTEARMRDLNETEERVLATAREIEAERMGLWSGPSIQFKGWPEVKGYRSKELGITVAIQTLVRRGLVKRYPHGAGYHTV